MTLQTRDYYTLRPLLAQSDDCMDISRRSIAIFWHSPPGIRLLLFMDGHLRWTQWHKNRGEAVDAAFETATWYEEHSREPF